MNVCDSSAVAYTKDMKHLGMVQSIIGAVFCLFLPFLGLLADIKFGKHRMALFCVFISLLPSGVFLAEVLLDEFSHSQAGSALMYFILPVYMLSRKALAVVLIIFGVDQLVGESSYQMSAFIWWYFWCIYVSWGVNSFIGCAQASILHAYADEITLFVVVAHVIGLLAILVSDCLAHKFLIQYYPSRNPFVLIYGVLKYAWNHKYPRLRSALTYWQQSYPSRLDLAKEMYGGPFTEEDVEGVKTFFRLLPLTVVMLVMYLPLEPGIDLMANVSQNLISCLSFSTYFLLYVFCITAIFALQFLACPLFQRVVPSMLKRIGWGIVFSNISKLSYVIIDVYFSMTHTSQTCLLASTANGINETSHHIMDELYWIILPRVLDSFAALLILPTSVEFVFAQTPYNMKGFMLGLWFSITGLYGIIGEKLIDLFKSMTTVKPSCQFYYYLMCFLLMCFSLLAYVGISRQYKLHIRNVIFSPYLAAEKFYDREISRRKKYYDQLEEERALENGPVDAVVTT